jgi:hypothetical protein
VLGLLGLLLVLLVLLVLLLVLLVLLLVLLVLLLGLGLLLLVLTVLTVLFYCLLHGRVQGSGGVGRIRLDCLLSCHGVVQPVCCVGLLRLGHGWPGGGAVPRGCLCCCI